MEYKTKKELVSTIIDAINDNRLNDKPVNELHNEVFNTYYFIIGRIFNAIEMIKEYEQDNFGIVSTDFSEPERVCNMYVYILGEEIINSLQTIKNNWDEDFTPELLAELKEELENI